MNPYDNNAMYPSQFNAMNAQQSYNSPFDLQSYNTGSKPIRSPTEERLANNRQIAELREINNRLPLSGPTPNELAKFESLRNAWSEYQIVRKLIIGGDAT